MKPLAILVASLAMVVTARAQSELKAPSLSVEVVSIKTNDSGGTGVGFWQRHADGRVTLTNMQPRSIITYAYELASYQLVVWPSWLETESFDVVMKIGGTAAVGESSATDLIRVVMQALLVDRFKLKAHRETRDLDAYALVLSKPGVPGPELRPATTACTALPEAFPRGAPLPGPPAREPTSCSTGRHLNGGVLVVDGHPLSALLTFLGESWGRMVIDRTGMTGNWQFTLSFSPDRRGSNALSLSAALQAQLGMTLESIRTGVEVLVIDSIRWPSSD